MGKNKILIDRWLNKELSISIGKLFTIATILLVVFFATKISINRNVASEDVSEAGLEIGSLIRKVKTELMKADSQRIKKNEHALFALKDFSMVISFTVKSFYKQGAKIDYQVVTVEGGGETANEKVQQLILHWDVIPAKRKKLENDKGGEIIVTPTDSIK